MRSHGVIYQYHKRTSPKSRLVGLAFLALSLGGMAGPLLAPTRLEVAHAYENLRGLIHEHTVQAAPLPKAVPVIFNPLISPDGTVIEPINTDFSLIVPKVGINAPVIPAVNPADPKQYKDALLKGVAHASTSFFPDEDGTVYLFSHSTNYDWFVKDLNAVFYLLKNLETDDLVVLFYKGERYTYKITDKKVVAPTEVSYLVPHEGKKRLILQTCWPPGSTTERLLLFADLVEEQVL